MGAQILPFRRVADVSDKSSRYAKNVTIGKTLGAVYTPARVAAAMTRWAIRSPNDSVLDPSCGEGVFLAAAHTRLADLGSRKRKVQGVDIDHEVAANVGAICSDFFAWSRNAAKVDVVLGNPPYIRSHLFGEQSRLLAFSQMARIGVKPSRLMSTWAPFLAICCALLTPKGRLAMVIPEELLTVGYAAPIRNFLLSNFRRVIVCFPEAGIFPSVQQATVLLLCDHEAATPQGLLTLSYEALESGDYDQVEAAPSWGWCGKWSHLFLSASQRTVVATVQAQLDWAPFSEYGRVEVGVVTGENSFFLLDRHTAQTISAEYLVPAISSARDLSGIAFSEHDFQKMLNGDRPAYLLSLNANSRIPASLRRYLDSGVASGVNQRYKCSIREPWFAVPGIRRADAVMLRQSGDMPRVVNLAMKCDATDTVHRISWAQPRLSAAHAASFLNTWTLISAELFGRSYGGGVLELMPSEANQLPMPMPTIILEKLAVTVDRLLREKHVPEAVARVDSVVLKNISEAEKVELRAALRTLVQRRKTRS